MPTGACREAHIGSVWLRFSGTRGKATKVLDEIAELLVPAGGCGPSQAVDDVLGVRSNRRGPGRSPFSRGGPPLHVGARAADAGFADIARWGAGWLPIEEYGKVTDQLRRLRAAFTSAVTSTIAPSQP